MRYIFLFGHRQQHGKDTCCNMLETILANKNITFKRTFFAKLLKKQVAERYNLSFEKMELNEYKLSCPSHLRQKQVRVGEELKSVPRTVRDVLIEEGCKGRDIWENTWANSVYRELLESGADIGFVSDYRYPNEFNCFDSSFNSIQELIGKPINKPKVYRVLVHRPDGVFKNDGADGELPDLDPSSWEYTILNTPGENWKSNLELQLLEMLKNVGV